MTVWLTTIAKVFHKKGAPLYLVGGAVRNQLLNLPITDYDLCGPLSANEVETLCEGTPVKTLGKISSFGTIGLEVTDEEGTHLAEYTTFRQDFYTKGHKPSKVVFVTSLTQDSFRRDFSINALYRPLTPTGLGKIIDPTGGVDDLKSHRLHTVTKNPYTILKDDGLRILRMVRFSCDFQLTPSPSLLSTAKEQSALLKEIAPERLKDELNKILLSDFRYPTNQGSSPVAKALSLFSSIPCYPYLFPSANISPQGKKACIAYPPSDKALPYRLLLLLWENPLETVKEVLFFLRYSNAFINHVVNCFTLLETFSSCPFEFISTRESLWVLVQKGEDISKKLPCLLASLGEKEKASKIVALLQTINKTALPWTLKDLALTGNHLTPLLDKSNHVHIGTILSALHKAVIVENLPNQKEVLLKQAQSLITELPPC